MLPFLAQASALPAPSRRHSSDALIYGSHKHDGTYGSPTRFTSFLSPGEQGDVQASQQQQQGEAGSLSNFFSVDSVGALEYAIEQPAVVLFTTSTDECWRYSTITR